MQKIYVGSNINGRSDELGNALVSAREARVLNRHGEKLTIDKDLKVPDERHLPSDYPNQSFVQNDVYESRLNPDWGNAEITTESGSKYYIVNGWLVDGSSDPKRQLMYELPDGLTLEPGKPIQIPGTLLSTPVQSITFATGRFKDVAVTSSDLFGSVLDRDTFHKIGVSLPPIGAEGEIIRGYTNGGNFGDVSRVKEKSQYGDRIVFDTLKGNSDPSRSNEVMITTYSGNQYFFIQGHVLNVRTGTVMKLTHGDNIPLEVGSIARMTGADQGTASTSGIRSITTPEIGSELSGIRTAMEPGRDPFEAARSAIRAYTQEQSQFAGR